MTKTRLFLLLAALVALAVPATASAADPLDPAQWHMTAPKSAKPFSMFNEINNSTIGHGDRSVGVDLVWSKGGDWVFFRKPVGNVRDHRGNLQPTEKVALYNTKARRYLVHKGQRFGINLDWSSKASYEWRVEHTVSKFHSALFNTSAGDYLVHGKRAWGINLQWLKDRRKAAQAENANGVGTVHDASVAMTAQPPVQGYVPFLGGYGGGGSKSVLTKVTVPTNGATLLFLKRGSSSADCAKADKVIRLTPGQSLSSDQMIALWGAATPSLATRLPFLACAVTQASTVWVNVQYRVTG